MSIGSVRLDILTNDVAVDGVQLALGDLERELLVLLCLCGGYGDADELAAQLWPKAKPHDAGMTLWFEINALRNKFPNPAMLQAEGNGYRLNAAISVDVWDIDEYLRAHRFPTRARCRIDGLLYRRLVRFSYTHRFRVAAWPWSRSLRDLIDRYRRDAGLWFGWALLAEDRIYEAHNVARDLVTGFPSCSSSRGLLETVEQRIAVSYRGARAV